ncbi:MAG TPA: hypothetical protein VGA72_07305 [Anaerolineales bacterium]
MRLFTQKIGLLICVFLISACVPLSTPAQATAPELEPTSTQNYHPLETRVGIEEIDQVLSAVASGDPQLLRSLVRFTTAKCTLLDGLGGPPKCREGEAEGTTVEVLPFMSGEGSFIHREDIENWQGIEVSGLYAIYRVSAAVQSEQYYPVGEVAIIFLAPENRPAVSLRLSEGGIVRVDHIFETSPESLEAILEREASELILAPGSR